MSILSGYIKWDSDFFGIHIAYIDSKKADENQIIEEINRLFAEQVDCIYLYSKGPITLNNQDSKLVDIKRTYLLESPVYKEIINSNIEDRPKFVGNSSDLYDLALQSGEYSRFKIDPHFLEKDFSRLYKKWIDNSLETDFADYVLVPQEGIPQALITAKIKGNRMKIGLFATDKKFRNMGIGSRLIQEIINEASIKDLKVEVVTQGDNKVACDFYENKGFTKESEIYIYHVWRTNDSLTNK